MFNPNSTPVYNVVRERDEDEDEDKDENVTWNCITDSLDLMNVLAVVLFYSPLRIFMSLQRIYAIGLVRSDTAPKHC